ncbi:hypothetical protein B0H10DRAFT_2441343, partial [Mycena sp. CBHHK59/15]
LAPVHPTGRPSQKRPSLSTGRAHPSVKIISKVARRTGPVRRRVTAVFDGNVLFRICQFPFSYIPAGEAQNYSQS